MTQYSKESGKTKNRETPKALLTIREACRLLNVHSNTLRRWTATGLIKAYRVGPGSHRRYRQEDIVALLTEQTTYKQISSRKGG
jgi:excisionase family DNA binding protein